MSSRLRPILRTVMAVIVAASLVVAVTTQDSLERTDALVFGGFCFVLMLVMRAPNEPKSGAGSDSPPAENA
ncbi:hypothetical protein [Tuwongella immobilis]|uniref:Uncharacterized protein n=1 Tax=Tuwongella immobilis TaxID=692036 RepID=A0A6C2YS97_9BACT|nr:hypothetical protein [Tuwongella immobilis]VIP04540.1 unnamed protein product [Tuwongella immobilis]VTS06441.1 unnamed protein product [Tuwongella immobilis]